MTSQQREVRVKEEPEDVDTVDIDTPLDKGNLPPPKKKLKTNDNQPPAPLNETDDKGTIIVTYQNGPGQGNAAPVNFLDLPGEIRNRVYEIWWEEGWTTDRKPLSRKGPRFRSEHDYDEYISRRNALPNIRLVSKQMWQESTPGFLQTMVFEIDFWISDISQNEGFLEPREFSKHEWTLSACRKKGGEYDRVKGDITGLLMTVPREYKMGFPVEADYVIDAFNFDILPHLGGLEYTFMLGSSDTQTFRGPIGDPDPTCFCDDTFRYSRRHLEEGWPGKLMMHIYCRPFRFHRENSLIKARFNKVLLFENVDPAQYSAISQDTWQQCLSVARDIVKESDKVERGHWGQDSCMEYDWGRVGIRFTRLDSNTTSDFENASAEHPAPGVTMVNLHKDGDENGIDYEDDSELE